MSRDASTTVTELRADGGAAANNQLMQFQADLLGIPVVRPKLLETTAAGAALLAGLGSGFWNGPDELQDVHQTDRSFIPQMDAERRRKLYAGWKQAVARVRTGVSEARNAG